jgi:hypothetical protein
MRGAGITTRVSAPAVERESVSVRRSASPKADPVGRLPTGRPFERGGPVGRQGGEVEPQGVGDRDRRPRPRINVAACGRRGGFDFFDSVFGQFEVRGGEGFDFGGVHVGAHRSTASTMLRLSQVAAQRRQEAAMLADGACPDRAPNLALAA